MKISAINHFILLFSFKFYIGFKTTATSTTKMAVNYRFNFEIDATRTQISFYFNYKSSKFSLIKSRRLNKNRKNGTFLFEISSSSSPRIDPFLFCLLLLLFVLVINNEES